MVSLLPNYLLTTSLCRHLRSSRRRAQSRAPGLHSSGHRTPAPGLGSGAGAGGRRGPRCWAVVRRNLLNWERRHCLLRGWGSTRWAGGRQSTRCKLWSFWEVFWTIKSNCDDRFCQCQRFTNNNWLRKLTQLSIVCHHYVTPAQIVSLSFFSVPVSFEKVALVAMG